MLEYFWQFNTMRSKQNLASALGMVSKKKIGGYHAFLRDNKASILAKKMPY